MISIAGVPRRSATAVQTTEDPLYRMQRQNASECRPGIPRAGARGAEVPRLGAAPAEAEPQDEVEK